MHTETEAMKRYMTTQPLWDTQCLYAQHRYRSYKAERGSIAEYDKMRTDTAEFIQALRRQLSVLGYNRFYLRVEQHCRAHRPFNDKPYRDWLGILQAVWSRALAGELPATLKEYTAGGVQHCDAQKLQAVAQETTVKTKTKAVKPSKAVKVKKPTHNIVGVRFVHGHNVHKVYSYTVPKKVKLHLGEEIVVPTNPGDFEHHAVAVVVALNHTPEYFGELKQVYGRVNVVKG